MCAKIIQPFEYSSNKEFHTKLVEWIGDVLYDELPEHGYEIRDEQIFTAFQIADAMCKKEVHLAEAGLGTGKTFAYLLSAIAYARLTKKPVVIACATTALQEQLAGEQGDIKKLSNLLGLEIDARMAKDPHQYICDVRVNENCSELGSMSDEIQLWLNETTVGERSEMPMIPDKIWKKIKWDESMSCELCDWRGFCKRIKAREHYRKAADLIIVDHETFFHDLWTREEKIADRQIPILPSYSAVIFDEGHKVLLKAAMQAGQSITREDVDSIIEALEEIQGARNSLVAITINLSKAYREFFEKLDQSIIPNEGSVRQGIKVSKELLKAADEFRKSLDHLLLELQIEQGLFMESLTGNQLQAFEGQIERATWALNRFIRNNSGDTICWVDETDQSFWVIPRDLGTMLKNHLYKKGLPVIFVSATLSNEGDFSYFKRSIGLEQGSHSTIGSPFELDEQVTISFANIKSGKEAFDHKIKKLIELLLKNGGRSLVLTNSLSEVRKIRTALKGIDFPFDLLWEDKGERGYLARTFRENETSVLVGSDFWEGIDVPGESLTMVIVWELPFDGKDPLIEQQRKEAKEAGLDPFVSVDYPEMGLKLKQGCGRLIRTEEDKGTIVILDKVTNEPWESFVMGALPKGSKRILE